MTATPRLAIPLYYDYASSLCYIAHRTLERLAPDLEALGLELDWSPLDLAYLLGWRRDAPIDGARRANVERVSSELDVPLRIPERWPDCRAALATSLVLAGDAREPTWRERVWTAIYEEGRRFDDDGWAELATALGLDVDPQELAGARDALDVHTRDASDSMVSGAPTFMLGSWPFGGIQDDDTMRAILGRYAERERARRARLDA